MKKFFLFAAAVVAAMTVNAKTWNFATVPGDFHPGNGSDAVVMNDDAAALAISAMTASHSADAAGTVDNFDGLGFYYKNSGGASKAGFKFFPEGGYLQLCGGDVTLLIYDAKAGDKLVVEFKAKGTTEITTSEIINGKGTAAIDELFPANIEVVTDASSKSKEDEAPAVAEFKVKNDGVVALKAKNGYNVYRIVLGEDTEAIDNIEVNEKAVKTFENGQLVIIKNGVRYNALGAKL